MFFDDRQQRRITELDHGTALVLAGPGCGKTHILARRVYYAITILGHKPEKMLCITFTNRAAREMSSRIEEYTGRHPDRLFIGNMHRFCLRFLYANMLIDADTAVMDEEDQAAYLKDALWLTTEKAMRDFLNKKEYTFGTDNDFPAYVIRHPYTPMTDGDYDRIAKYRRYQAENRLIDFDDILQLTFLHLLDDKAPDYVMTGYDWAQVDEVQDMTPLQLAITDRLTCAAGRTVVYFGDEQQAIFRFTGAGGPALDWLKRICANRIYRLHRNYRSPAYLVDMCNELAARWLGIPRLLLPEANDTGSAEEKLLCYRTDSYGLMHTAAALAVKWQAENPEEDTAVLVRTNREGDDLSALFNALGIRHFHISRQDLFHQIPFKTVWAHLAAVMQPLQTQAWARLLYKTRAVRTLGGARDLVNTLRHRGICPAELLDFDRPDVAVRMLEAFGDNGRLPASVRRIAERFTEAYGAFYKHWRDMFISDGGSLVSAVAEAAHWFCSNGYTAEVQRLDYLLKLIGNDIVGDSTGRNFREQLSANLYDLLSYTESDLFANGIVEERISIMTIHKAKGLEMSNVIVLDATNTYGPSDDAARLLYVAFSRARQRLAIGLSGKPTGALATVIDHFNRISPYASWQPDDLAGQQNRESCV